MADLLSHVLVAYALGTVAGWRLEWLSSRWIAVAMVGAVVPDLNRIGLLVGEPTVEAALGTPFSFGAIQTLGGVIVLAGIGTLCFETHRFRAYGLLLAGGLSHLLFDAIKRYADGEAGAWLFPLTWARHPTPNLYVSSEPAVLLVALSLAVCVWALDRRWVDESS
ncbi:metal-dependent hydrolase [Halostagnicola kamekurae]|uniref:LexA-binding, inner membrane-associated hydrolase n=1 Tax=Halostagnicola kamekurae TaxID=619731 RepID=A0A1I6S907_9EURY|nr:metal-dependent hydrolase [Halostagnicola kamekurae]SFS73469.1 hypothetical protein SAMN04488556_2503 [Halostagnicola kamekurae]